LGLKLEKIKGFEKNAGDVDNCMNQVVYLWLNMEEEEDDDDDEKTTQRETFFEALVEVNNKGLAQELKEKYEGKGSLNCLMSLYVCVITTLLIL